jgi:hypothetical protein
MSSETLGQVESKPWDSHFWQGLMEVKKICFGGVVELWQGMG